MKIKKTLFTAGIILLVVVAIFLFNPKTNGNTVSGIQAIVYKSSSCGCCDIHSNYLKSKGDFDIDKKNVPDVSVIKDQYEIPYDLQSCHTTIIGEYFVEGHIPIEAINKLLEEKPDIAGIAMPGMPSGSPGMPGIKQGEFIIYGVEKNGNSYEFMRL